MLKDVFIIAVAMIVAIFLVSFTLIVKVGLILLTILMFIGYYFISSMQSSSVIEEYKDVDYLNELITPLDVEPEDRVVIKTTNTQTPVALKPFVMPFKFKTSNIKLDSLAYVQNIAKEISDYFRTKNVNLEYVESDRTPQFNTLKFRILATEEIVRGVSRKVQADVSKITKRLDDLKIRLGMEHIKIISPIPGTQYIGITVPCSQDNIVQFGNIIDDFINHVEFNKFNQPINLSVPLGVYSGGNLFIDIIDAPHILIAGKSGSGKSSVLNDILAALLMTHTSKTLNLYMVDGKLVELNRYKGIPHLNGRGIVTDIIDFNDMLDEVLKIIADRTTLLASKNLRDIQSYNQKYEDYMPYVVVVVDEYGDFMLDKKAKVDGVKLVEAIETKLVRIAQIGRAMGVHLVLTTQRPDATIITGLIKANIGTKIALLTSSAMDSRIIIDESDAASLNGKGDGILKNDNGLTRFQAPFIDDDEMLKFIKEVKKNE